MKLLNNSDYKKVEKYLKEYYLITKVSNEYKKSINEILQFFKQTPYKEFLDIFYLHRFQYKNRYPSNSILFSYLSQKLFLQECTLYVIRKDIVYKSAMIFYKYNLLGNNYINDIKKPKRIKRIKHNIYLFEMEVCSC